MPIEQVVIAGDGLGGWMAAALIARALPEMKIVCVGDCDRRGSDTSLGVPTFAETLLPRDLETLARSGFGERQLVRGAAGAFSLGTALTGWRTDVSTAFVPFGSLGAPIGAIAFHQLCALRRARGDVVNLSDYSLAALCAQSGRFAPTPPHDRSVRSTLTHGLHVAVHGLAEMFQRDALVRGVTRTMGTVVACDLDAEGLTTALRTDNGDVVTGDLFIDAGGPRGPLAGGFEEWADIFRADHIATALRASPDAPPLYAHIDANPVGWQSFVPVNGAIGETLVTAGVADHVAGAVRYSTGTQTSAWRGNVVAIGGAAAVMDPVAGLQLHIALEDVARLVLLFPNDRWGRAEAAEYNRQWNETIDCAFDVALLRYVASERADNAFWAEARAIPVPDRLAYRMALFQSCGRVVLHDGETFDEGEWVAHFDALGLRADRYDALASALPVAQVDDHFSRVRSLMLAALGEMPTHAQILASVVR